LTPSCPPPCRRGHFSLAVDGDTIALLSQGKMLDFIS
jgi:hypothetical protein